MYDFNLKLKQMIKKILLKIYKQPAIISGLILYSILLSIAGLGVLLAEIFNIYIGVYDRFGEKLEGYALIVFACIVAPIVETYLFQWLPYYLFDFKKKLFLISAILGCFFGLLHYTSLMYVAVASCAGFLFLLFYVLLARRHNNFVAFLTIAIVHSLYNAVVFFYHFNIRHIF
jgi:signal transduction histidine kinase